MFFAPLTASILALFYAFLAIITITKRRKYAIGLMTAGNEEIARCMRALGNLNEYAPLFLIQLLIGEIQELNATALGVLSALFVIGRFIHAISLFQKKASLRILGMSFTFTSFITLAILQLFDLSH